MAEDPYSAGFMAGYSKGSQDRIEEIHKAGRLLPPGGEVRTQLRFVHRKTGRVTRILRHPDDGEGRDWRMEQRTYYVAPWSPVVSDNGST